MRILSCEINKVPVKTILDFGANCNIIDESIAKIVGLKIDNTSDTEIYSLISELNILGIIRAIEISVLSQDRKWEQENAIKVDFPNKTLTFFDGTSYESNDDAKHRISDSPKGLNIFNLPELLEQILYFLEIDQFLYPALFVNRFWYHCGAPILWRRIEFINEDYQRVMCEKTKPLYCSTMLYLRLEGLKISDALISTILRSCPDICTLILDKSKGFTNIPIIEIARYCPKLLHLSLNSCICFTNRCITEIARSCSKLKHLEFGDCSISNKALEEIAHNCNNLKYLSLEGCKEISEEVIKKLNSKIKIKHPDYPDDEFSNSDLPPTYSRLFR
ncbi:9104_t:CDS:2 [Cetraspora pellucida]|uniref:9104_t:CDS:1 n=1 Tax=Cetraspora pellucida TaxID=1433469 RepID=A0ACA9JVS6_9GLOM|nr:9104_t:CDS:2 [Cetraspora pellucida]